ncbi:YhcN/YlaJ family sporulation lipoprotein [Neobacillus drentensis]|uniref:YhcN/YlaJ family sporulation lipoprotein n=1 Tax=Neobacillus drentensis TaxID=220684 RepID=UPI003000B087
MVKKSWVTFVLATSLLGLTGCADNNKNGVNHNNLGNNVRNNTNNGVDVRNVRNNTNNDLNVRNVSDQNLRVSSRAIRNVESLNEVDQAHVIIRNNDAYVAVRLDTNQNGNRARNGTTGTGPNMNATYGNGYNSGTTGTNGSTNLHANTGNPSNANLAGTNGTRTTARGTVRTSTLDQRITRQVRAADRNIDNVYISYDTDTFGQMTNFSNNIRTGTNRDGLWNDFTNSVNRMFR